MPLTVIEEHLADHLVYYGKVSRAESLFVQAAGLAPVLFRYLPAPLFCLAGSPPSCCPQEEEEDESQEGYPEVIFRMDRRLRAPPYRALQGPQQPGGASHGPSLYPTSAAASLCAIAAGYGTRGFCCVGEALVEAVVATDTVSADVDYDNGSAAVPNEGDGRRRGKGEAFP